MKKLFIYALASGFLFTACQKDESQTEDLPNGSRVSSTVSVSPVPASFNKKVLLEEITSTTNGNAPLSAMEITALSRSKPDYVVSISLHTNDIMADMQSNRLISSYMSGIATVPTALVNRYSYSGITCLPYTMYASATNASLLKPTACGLAINSVINGRIAQVDVHAGFATTYTGSYKMTSYLVEDKVANANPAFYQTNSQNNTPGSPFYNLGNPIRNYVHNNVLRKVLSNPAGDPINPIALVAGGSDVITYKIDLPQKYNSGSKWYVVSFITDNATNEVLNVQSAMLGTLKDWN